MFFTPSPLWAFVVLLAVHWLGDFFLQSHWMSINKSKRLDALSLHVGIYTVVLFFGAGLIFGPQPGLAIVKFAALNGALHFATDYLTSRWSSRLWGQAFPWNGLAPVVSYPPQHKPIHNFFVVIGVDQFIHQITLAATMAWLLANQ